MLAFNSAARTRTMKGLDMNFKFINIELVCVI
jgi:hypothetical protein